LPKISCPPNTVKSYQNGNFYILLQNNRPALRVIAKKSLREFWSKHPDCEQQLKSWFKEAEKSIWANPKNIKKEYPTASIFENNRVVFNKKGNHYRLIVRINYDYGMVWIRFIGTHSQYDKIDASEI
jgi:mRNA interferase HigB